MPRDVSELARRLARDAEAVCRHYLCNGRRQGRSCAGFRMPAMTGPPRARAAGVRKAPRHEIAVGGAPTVQRALWGFGRGVRLEGVGSHRATGSVWLEAWVSVYRGTSGPDGTRQDERCPRGPIWRIDARVCAAG